MTLTEPTALHNETVKSHYSDSLKELAKFAEIQIHEHWPFYRDCILPRFRKRMESSN